MKMPGMNGIELYEESRAGDPASRAG